MMYGYIYKTTILNKDSELYQCFYRGQHKAPTYDKKYFGSGKIISHYIRKFGTALLKNEILLDLYFYKPPAIQRPDKKNDGINVTTREDQPNNKRYIFSTRYLFIPSKRL